MSTNIRGFGTDWRIKDGVVQRRKRTDVYVDLESVSVDELCTALKAAESKPNVGDEPIFTAEKECELYSDYETIVHYFMSWLPATEKEIKEARAAITQRKVQTSSHLDAQEAQLRKARPELFK